MSQQNNLIEKLQTPRGMAFAILALVIASIGIGLAFVLAYKLLDIPDNFAQGSGSLVQAIWGSAATIAASLLAIILATEALRLAKKTNELTERSNHLTDISNKFQKTQSAPYEVWMKLKAALLAFDQYSAMVKPLLSSSGGLITKNNINGFECVTFELLDKLNVVYKSPIFNMLNQMEFKGDSCGGFAKTYASPLMMTMVFMHDYKSHAEKKSEIERIDFHNTNGRSVWASLYDIRAGLIKINLKNIEDCMSDDVGDQWIDNKEAVAIDVVPCLPKKMQTL